MPSRFTAQSGKGALFVALALVATLLVPSVYTWAVKSTGKPGGIDMTGSQDIKNIDPEAMNYFRRQALALPDRPLGVSPFENFRRNIPQLGKRKGLMLTPAGFINPKDSKAFDGLPVDLRPVAVHPAAQGKGVGLGGNAGYIQITEASVKDPGTDRIEQRIRDLGATVMGAYPDRTFLVHGDSKAMAALVKEPFIEAALPYGPAFKMSINIGRTPLADPARNSKTDVDVNIIAWDKADVGAILDELKKGNHADTAQIMEDGFTIRATLNKNELKQIAKNDLVKGIYEVPEFRLKAFIQKEHPPTVQVGENEHTNAATPYWDAGVDGGGCGNPASPAAIGPGGSGGPGNQNTNRIDGVNTCNTAVPAVVVAVTDNGASIDQAALSHQATIQSAATAKALIDAGTHRKIRAYQIGGDESTAGGQVLGSTCDSPLSGGQTHGNVMAGMIAGNASALGFQFQKNTNAASFGDVRRVNLDGVARGARLTIQDNAKQDDCAIAERVERGNFITIGSLLTSTPASPGLLDAAYASGARLHVLPFGAPDPWGPEGPKRVGQYDTDPGTGGDQGPSADWDRYSVNNLEHLGIAPVGNAGSNLINGRNLINDYFDGNSSIGSDTTLGLGFQIGPPATAKDIVTVGGVCEDVQTMFGAFNEEENPQNYTSKGPVDAIGYRSAPIVLGVSNDRTPTGGGPVPYGMYTVKSKDNNQDGEGAGGTPVDAELDEQARGTSFGAASVTSAAAIMEDYFHQGFYPTGDRIQANRVPFVSGSLIKAMLGASANLTEQLIGPNDNSIGNGANDNQVATTRGSVVAITAGVNDVLVNNQQGYGRVIVSQVLPIANWPFIGIPPDGAATGDTIERPALGLIVWDGVDPDGAGSATAEPPISNSDTVHTHSFRVFGTTGEIRVCLAWPDPPGTALVNDLDLELVSPTNKVYDGNVYDPASQLVGQWGKSRARTIAEGGSAPNNTDQSDHHNPIECVHLHDNPDANPGTPDNQIEPGIWTVRVERDPTGGATPGSITVVSGTAEDGSNGTVKNNRLDLGKCSDNATRGCNIDNDCRLTSGSAATCVADSPATDEDLDNDGLLDNGGQVYGLVVSGPVAVVKDGTNTAPQFASFPQAIVRLDKSRYSCSDDARVLLMDSDATLQQLSGGLTLKVYNAAGTLVDTEGGLTFSGSNASYTSSVIAVRQGASGVGNGVLEGDTGYTIEATYVDATANSQTVYARAPMDCDPNFLGGVFGNPGQRNTGDLLFGGCDNDQFFDASELVTYSVAVVNNDLLDEYTDVSADLVACRPDPVGPTGVCATAFNANGSCKNTSADLSVTDTPKNIGRLPAGNPTAVSFSVQVASSLSTDGKVCLGLNLSQTGATKDLSRASFRFEHGTGKNRGSLHYSTDFTTGGDLSTSGRDLNRNLTIENPDVQGQTVGALDERITFSSMFPGTCAVNVNITCYTNADCPSGVCNLGVGQLRVRNSIAGDGVGTPADTETYPVAGIFNINSNGAANGILERHALLDADPTSGTDLIPWNFDNNNGGWYAVEDAASIPGSGGTLPMWHYVPSGVCGFQTQSKSNCVTAGSPGVGGTPGNNGGGPCVALTAGAFTGGAWHTGSGVQGTCAGAAVCGGGSAVCNCYIAADCTAQGSSGPCNGGADNPDCGNYTVVGNTATPARAEYKYSLMISPIIEKVNQGNDKNGFPYTVEFQRLAMNTSAQVRYTDNTLYVNIDNNIDSNNPNALIKPGVLRGDGLAYYLFASAGPINLNQVPANQNTFGPTTDPDGSLGKCYNISTGVVGGVSCTLDSQCSVGTELCGKLTGDETGFPGFDRPSINPDKDGGVGAQAKPHLKVGAIDQRPFPGPGDVYPTGSEDTVAGPSRNIDVDLNDYEDNGLQFYTPGNAGNRFQIALGYLVVEQDPAITLGAGDGDFGWSVDDIVFEWDEVHPVPETTGACATILSGSDFANSGCLCATLSVDRASLYDCNETLKVTVNDPKRASTASGSCNFNTGAGETLQIRAWSNSEPFPGENFTLTESGDSGVFTGNVPVTGVFDTAGAIFTVPGTELNIFFAYQDDQCDSNHNGRKGQSDFQNLDGDFLTSAEGRDGICGTADDQPAFFGADGICGTPDDTGDNCPSVYNPLINGVQADGDGDGIGNGAIGKCSNDSTKICYQGLTPPAGCTSCVGPFVQAGCDNCPNTANNDQADSDLDGVGDACDYDDIDHDGQPNDVDNCPDTYNPLQETSGGGVRGNACKAASNAQSWQDGDGIPDKDDNCPRIYNFSQANTDGASESAIIQGQQSTLVPLGDACDGDCQATCVGGSRSGLPCRWDKGRCTAVDTPHLIGDECINNVDCGATTGVCTGGNQGRKDPAGTGHDLTPENLAYGGIFGFANECPGGSCTGTLTCSTQDDDFDLDAVKDRDDNCTTFANPTPLPGSVPPVQIDTNLNGIGDACDPVGSFDENGDGIPDDTANGAFFALGVSCSNVPLARLIVLSASVRDRAELRTCTGGPTTVACSAGTNVGKACGICVGAPFAGSACALDSECAPGTCGATGSCPGGVCTKAANSCGDGDSFADRGEIVRLTLFLQNVTGINLTGITLSITTADPDIQCLLKSSMSIASFNNGASIDTKSLTPPDDATNPSDGKYFEMSISPTAAVGSAARGSLTLTMNSNEAGGTTSPVAVNFLEGLDIPPGVTVAPTASRCDGDRSVCSITTSLACVSDADCPGGESCLKVARPGVLCDSGAPGTTPSDPICNAAHCSIYVDVPCTVDTDCSTHVPAAGTCVAASPTVLGACRPGLIWEDFEHDDPTEAGSACPSKTAGCGGTCAGYHPPNCFGHTIGFIQMNAVAVAANPQGIGANTQVVGKACFGFIEILGATAAGGCQIDPDFETDWHFHTAASPDLGKAYKGHTSMHWGRHTSPTSRTGDTTPLREIEAFVTNPINLTVLPGAGDLVLSFWHIISLTDDNRVNFQTGQGSDVGDVQITVDSDPAPGTDNFGRWQKLVAFQNVAEHQTSVFSHYGNPNYCEWTPSDAARSSNPNVYGETLCFPDFIWSHSGNVLGSNIFAVFNAQTSGALGSLGEGVWVQSKFNLSNFLGQRVKIRWIGSSWSGFLNFWDSYMEPPAGAPPFDIGTADDGWWIDSIRITGSATAQAPPTTDTSSIPLTAGVQCPVTAADNCDQTKGTTAGFGGGQSGFSVVFNVRDTNGDGVVEAGEGVLLDASQTANPGGCVEGVPQYRFTKDPGAVLLQDWSTAASLKLSPGAAGNGDLYQVQVRCSSDTSCLTVVFSPPTGAVANGCPVYAGPAPTPIEVTTANAWSFTTTSTSITGTMSNLLNSVSFNPGGQNFPAHAYGHSFLRTDGLSISAADAGLVGTCSGTNCTITSAFKNVINGQGGNTTSDNTAGSPPGLGSCDLNAIPPPLCKSPSEQPATPASVTWTDTTVPTSNTVFYYVVDSESANAAACPNSILGQGNKCFGPAGPSRTNTGVGLRTITPVCP